MSIRSSLGLLLVAVSLSGCGAEPGAPAGDAAAAPATGVGAGSDPAAAPAAQTEPAAAAGEAAQGAVAPAAQGPAAAAPAAQPAVVLATSETNWGGVVAEVTELRRKGNTLTARVRLRNTGQEQATVEVKFPEVSVLDAANARKYEVLRDEKGTYIASLRSGYGDRWYEYLQPGDVKLIWMKFPAPPPEVVTVTLQLPSTPPFEDLAIQDG